MRLEELVYLNPFAFKSGNLCSHLLEADHVTLRSQHSHKVGSVILERFLTTSHVNRILFVLFALAPLLEGAELRVEG